MASSIAAVREVLGEQVELNTARVTHARLHAFGRDALVQAGRTPYDVIFERGPVKLRYYPPLRERRITLADGSMVDVARTPRRTPLVIVPPLAVNMFIYDLFPQRSLVRYLRARGFELYLIDWGEPGPAENRNNLARYFAELLPGLLARVRQHSGKPRLNLHGWSFGGLFALCHAAMADDSGLANLVLVGAPVDYHDNGVLGQRYRALARRAHWLRDTTGLTAHRLPRRWLRSPGWLNALAFKFTSPMAVVKSYMGLLRNLHDPAFVRSHATNAAFLDRMVAYPGGVVADFIDYLWVDNVLGAGRLPMADATATLADVHAPILNIAGRNDVIVTPACSQAMFKYVSSHDTTAEVIDGGHVGIVSSLSAMDQSWARIADWLIARD